MLDIDETMSKWHSNRSLSSVNLNISMSRLSSVRNITEKYEDKWVSPWDNTLSNQTTKRTKEVRNDWDKAQEMIIAT